MVQYDAVITFKLVHYNTVKMVPFDTVKMVQYNTLTRGVQKHKVQSKPVKQTWVKPVQSVQF